ncbi:MAG: hypothetical protein F4W92_08675 [Gammaproteobacteria bacterium]|nr:hypothetical protein [Gammaproteobacteria bacterium]
MPTLRKQSSTTSILILKTGIIFALGLAIGVLSVVVIQNFYPKEEEHATQNTAQQRVQKSPTGSSLSSPLEITGNVGEFQNIFKHRSTAEQYTSLYVLLSRANETELKEWWIHTQNIERESHREIAQQVIIGNLSAINPKEALQCLNDVSVFQMDRLLRTLFSEWSVFRLEEAVEIATTLPGPRRIVALQTILETRDDLSEEQQRMIARQLKGEDTYLMLVSEAKASQSLAEPQDSWNTLLNDDVANYLQTETFLTVLEAWREQIGFAVLSKIYEMPLFGIKYDLMKAVARVNPEGALDYTRGLQDQKEKESLSREIVLVWARKDPRAALAASLTFEPSSIATTLESVVALTWARTNPIEFIENIESISERPRLLSLETAFSSIARQDPKNAIEMLSSVERYVGNTSSLLTRIVNQWANRQPDSATDWVLNNFAREDPQRQMLLRGVLQRLASQDPDKAFELALAQPAPSEGYEIEFQVMQEIILYGDIEVAKKFLPRVRTKAKQSIYSSVATELVNAGQNNEALELGYDLAESNQQMYFWHVMLLWASNDPTDLYESLENLQSSDLASLAARQLISQNRFDPVLTDDQIEQARTLLTAEDEALVEQFENR